MILKYLLLSVFLLFSQQFCNAQKKAVTELGDEVILYENGTWKYSREFQENDSNKIELNPVVFKKSKNASFLLKSAHGNLGYWVDPKKWSFGKNASNPNADFELELKGQSLQAVIISEDANIPIESFVKLAIVNGRQNSPDLKLLHKEYRTVNGIKVLHLIMEGTVVGVKFLYYGYYFSNDNTTVQFLVMSYASSLKKLNTEGEELLNGLTVINESISDTTSINKNLEVNNGNISQGLYSPNNNCKPLFAGNWQYNINGKVVKVERTFAKTIEYTENKQYLSEYENRWLGDCSYEIIFKKSTDPSILSKIKKGEIIKVDILSIDKKIMTYQFSFRGVDGMGEMQKSE